MTITIRALGVLATALALGACGTTDVERATTGAVIGGAVGAVTDGDIAESALIGGALGAVSCSVAPAAPNCY